MKKFFSSLYIAIVKMIDHDGVEHSGYMSFMVLVSIFPFFIFILALTSFFNVAELGENFIKLTLENFPAHSIDSIQSRIQELLIAPPQQLLTLAVFGTLWTSSSYVECLRTILNRVYDINSPPNYIFRRFLSIFQFLLISLMIGALMLLLVIIPIGLEKIPAIVDLFKEQHEFLTITRYVLLFTSLFLTACSLYYIIPNAKIKFTEVAPGAFITVILWLLSGKLLSKYILYYNQLNIVYGSLGSIIVTMIFFYIINMIFIYGAEFNYLMRQKK
jgi:membrane protein